MRVLVVEDDTLDARHIQRCLRDQAQWSLEVVSTMAEAQASLMSDRHDVILLDMNLPDAGPKDTVIRILPAAGEVPVLVLTGISDPAEGLKTIAQGAGDWMSKEEVNPQRLERAIRYVLARRDLKELQLQTERAQVLEEANRRLERLIFVASHDLQEPLRQIAMLTQLLERRTANVLGESEQGLVKMLSDAALHMRQLVAALLDLSHVHQGVAQPLGIANLEEAFDRATANLEPSILETGATVSRGSLPSIPGRQLQLVQLFQNLVGNALKFGREGVAPAVSVTARRKDRCWVVSVSDQGIGIEPRYQEKIFEVFRRLHTQRERPGAGIGLSICQEIVEQHGGTIGVTSAPGEGATFIVTLPDGDGSAGDH